MKFSEFFSKKVMEITIYFLAVLILADAALLLYLKTKLSGLEQLSHEMQYPRPAEEHLRNVAALVDIHARNYLVTRSKESLDKYETNLQSFEQNLDSLRYSLKEYAYPDSVVNLLTLNVGGELKTHKAFLSELKDNDSLGVINGYKSLASSAIEVNGFLNKLHGYDEGRILRKEQETTLVGQAIIVLQVGMLVLIPQLIFFVFIYKRNRDKLENLTRQIDESNRKYVFNSMEDIDLSNEEVVKASLLENLGRATDFIQRITNGDYTVRWEGMNDRNRDLNKGNIAGELIRMREQMKQVKEQDRIRMWTTEGLSKFGDIIRINQNNFEALADTLISSVVKYVDAKVGGLYILEDDEEAQSQILSLSACYAYNKKKFITKKIEIGEGLIGQAYMEGQTIHLQKVPSDYMSITSGLGESSPKSVIMIPLKVNEKIEGVLELASLKDFERYEIEFLEKLGETLAASIVSIRTGAKTKELLRISQEQSEEMRAQEEEMRQNMEELEATQEQMGRQMQELNILKESLEKEKYLFGSLMDNIPDHIYFKDRQCKLVRISKHMAKAFGRPESELLGKSDFDFQDEAHATEAFEDEQNIMKTRKPKIDFLEKEVHDDGEEVWVSTTKMPLVDSHGNVVGTFGISRDVSVLKRLEQDVLNKDRRLNAESKQHEEKIKSLEEELKKLRSK